MNAVAESTDPMTISGINGRRRGKLEESHE